MSQLLIEENKDLKAFNSFGLPSIARFYARPSSLEEIKKAFSFIAKQRLDYLILGGGSNVLFKNDFFDGMILHLNFSGIEIEEIDRSFRVTACASENWNNFVQYCLSKGIRGLENLSLIPGSVGACPVQNVGAYGVEVAEFIESVVCFDPKGECVLEIPGSECEFAYRDSIFKRERSDLVILSVNFVFDKNRAFSLDYSDLEARVNNVMENRDDCDKAIVISEVVSQIRAEKLPDPSLLGNAGSFFKNPIVSSEKYHQIKLSYPDLVAFPYGDQYKLAAGWMIDFLGFKGRSVGGASVHDKQALVLVNKTGDASSADLFSLVDLIQSEVRNAFGVDLEIEPKIL